MLCHSHTEVQKDCGGNDSEVGDHASNAAKGFEPQNNIDDFSRADMPESIHATSYSGYLSGSARGLYRSLSGSVSRVYNML